MAGIGFRLNKMAATGGYLEGAKAYIASAVITSGPWLTATVTLSIFASVSAHFLSAAETSVLFATITYAFSASLILAGGVQLIITRCVSDRIYLKDIESIGPLCAGVLCWAGPFFLLASPILFLAPFEWRYRLLAVTLLLTLSLSWLVMVFLSATRHYVRIVNVFLVVYLVSLFAGIGLGKAFGLEGGLAGFTAGQVIGLALLLSHVYLEYPTSAQISFGYLSYFWKYWDLVLVGLLYACSVWIDNFVYWLSPQATVVAGFFHLFPPHDSAKLVSLLLTIPAAAIFLVHVETQIDMSLRAYLACAENKRPLREIRSAREALNKAAWDGIGTIVKVQGVVALAAMVLAASIAGMVGLSPAWILHLRVVIVAASLQYLMLLGVILLLYLDHRKGALLVLATFVVLDAVGSQVTLMAGQGVTAAGYLLAGVVAVSLALWLLRQRLHSLEYVTFMLQPVA